MASEALDHLVLVGSVAVLAFVVLVVILLLLSVWLVFLKGELTKKLLFHDYYF